MSDTRFELPMPDPAIAFFGKVLAGAPATLKPKLFKVLKEGQEAVRRGEPRMLDEDVPPSELIERRQEEIRAAALRACVPSGRVARAWRGLACLDPADQCPVELRRWLDDPDALTLIMAGTTGSGKTDAAYALAVEAASLTGAATRNRRGDAVARKLLVRAWTYNGYLMELRPDGSPDPVWTIRDRARTAELLILDDLGAEVDGQASQHARTEMGELLSYRVDRRLRTIVTTNLRGGALKAAIGAPALSRLKQDATIVKFLGPDRRNLNDLDW